jgi:nucleoid-associated protein YgaU
MTRETRIGIVMVLLLVGVFGFLVYKRMSRPGENLAQVSASADEQDPSADPDLSESTQAFPEDEDEPEILPVAAQQRPLPQEVPDNESDPFDEPESTPARSPAKLPTTIPEPDEEFDAVADSFDEPAESRALDRSPSFGAAEPESDGSDHFGSAADSQTEMEVVETKPPALTPPAKPAIKTSEPEEEFEDFAAEEPVAKTLPAVQTPPPAKQPSLPSFGDAEEDEEEMVSVKARTELPEQALDFGDMETEVAATEDAADSFDSQPQDSSFAPPETVLEESAPLAAVPQILFDDDADDDRYGDYEPVDFSSADHGGAVKKSIAGNRHVVQAGENLWSISQKKYGTGKYFQALAIHNHQHIPDPGKMKPGVEVLLPPAEELERRYAAHIHQGQGGPKEPAAAAGSASTPGEYLIGNDGRPLYRVGTGDTLSGIAQRYLGRARRWEQLLEMNRDVLKDGNSLKVGAVLRLPNDAVQLKLSNQPREFR